MLEGASRLRLGLWGAAAAFFAGGLLLFWTAPDPERLAALGDEVTVRRVQTERVRSIRVKARAELASLLEAQRSVQLFAETQGPVVAVGAEALDRVEAGRLLAQIDPLQAEVAVERAKASLARSRSELSLARSELARRRSLAEQGVASDADLEAAENAEKVALAALRQARAELKQAEDDLDNKTILAPFAGVLRVFQLEKGEYVQPGQELGELLDLTTARATIGLSDREVVVVRAGQPVEVRVQARPGEVFEGEVLRVGAATDPATRKFPVEVEVPNADGRLLPGMVASVTLDLGAERPHTPIPREAAGEEFGLRFVWVVEPAEEGLVVRRRRIEVRTVPFRPADLEVVSGLSEGDEIALTDVRRLRDGERVQRNGARAR